MAVFNYLVHKDLLPPSQKEGQMAITRVVVDFVGDLTAHEQEKIAERIRDYADGVVATGYDNVDSPRVSQHDHRSTKSDACPGCWANAIDKLSEK